MCNIYIYVQETYGADHVTGSSKAMEPDAGVTMMVDAITKYNVI